MRWYEHEENDNERLVRRMRIMLYSRCQSRTRWHAGVRKIGIERGITFQQADRCVYSKINRSGGAYVLGNEYISHLNTLGDLLKITIIVNNNVFS